MANMQGYIYDKTVNNGMRMAEIPAPRTNQLKKGQV